jgi:hypothetical protein
MLESVEVVQVCLRLIWNVSILIQVLVLKDFVRWRIPTYTLITSITHACRVLT